MDNERRAGVIMDTEVDLSQEFNSPDINLLILLHELEQEMKLMQLDLSEIRSPIFKGLCQEKYLKYKEKYFYLMAKDLELLKMYQIDDEENSEQDI